MDNFVKFLVFSKSHSFDAHLRNYAKIIFIWCPIVSALFIFGFGSSDKLISRILISMIIAITVSSFCYIGAWAFGYLYQLYRRKRGWKIEKHGVLRGFLFSFPFLIPGLFFGFKLASKASSAIGYSFSPPSFNDYSSGIIFGIMVSGFFTLFEVVRESKEAKQAAELKYRTLENEKLKAQISALTAQMNPHLLFNSLNTIASTITTDPTSAEDMVVKLSELYRGILKSSKGDIHSLESELLLCQSYLEIERKRFGERINYTIEIQDTINPKKVNIPVLLLQPLVENAIKHGLAPKREGGRVSIKILQSTDEFIILVIDNGVGIDMSKPTLGTRSGMANCESRLQLKYGSASKFNFSRNERDETVISISLPTEMVSDD